MSVRSEDSEETFDIYAARGWECDNYVIPPDQKGVLRRTFTLHDHHTVSIGLCEGTYDPFIEISTSSGELSCQTSRS